MRFWKEHKLLRVALMLLCLTFGIILVLVGWKMTGQPAGLGLMLLGILLMLTALLLYNLTYQ